MFEYYNNILTIHAAVLYNKPMYDAIVVLDKQAKEHLSTGHQEAFMDTMLELKALKNQYKRDTATFMTKYSYDSYKNRKKIITIKKGGNGRYALIEWASLGESLKTKIREHIGYDPASTTKNQTFKDYVLQDEAAITFFNTYEKSNGEKLTTSQINQYIARANVLNAISTLLKERENKRSAFGKSRSTLWQNIAKAIQEFPEKEIPHKLPKNHRRLKEAYTRYQTHGYVGLLHKGLENDNTKKIKGEIADWWLAMYCLPNKMVVPAIMVTYNEVKSDKGWPSLTPEAVSKWLETPDLKRKWVLARHGREEWKRQFGHYVKRKRDNWFPNAYWAIDGSKIDWVHYEENAQGMASRLKIDPVVDIYSEKILGWSFSQTEDHTDHFKAIKMAVNNAGARPYLFTYDNQSGHKTKKMQELYDKLIARKGGTHYPNKAYAHNSPVENIFKRLQQQVINRLWFSDKQSPTVRTIDNKPNIDFIKQNKHLLKTKEELIRAWEICVKLWNEAPHPKFKDLSRNEVYQMEAPIREEVDFLDSVDMFWIYNNRKITYKRGGLLITVAGNDYEYEVLDQNNRIDIEFRRKYIGSKFIVKYDPDHMGEFVELYKEDANGDRQFVAHAQPKRSHESIPVLMQDGDKAQWKQDYDVTELEFERDIREIEALRSRTGITPEQLIEQQELMIKLGGTLPKEQRSQVEENQFARI